MLCLAYQYDKPLTFIGLFMAHCLESQPNLSTSHSCNFLASSLTALYSMGDLGSILWACIELEKAIDVSKRYAFGFLDARAEGVDSEIDWILKARLFEVIVVR